MLLVLLLFGLLVLFVILGWYWGWICSFGGDLLVVVWFYYLMGSVFRVLVVWLVFVVFVVGVLLELG